MINIQIEEIIAETIENRKEMYNTICAYDTEKKRIIYYHLPNESAINQTKLIKLYSVSRDQDFNMCCYECQFKDDETDEKEECCIETFILKEKMNYQDNYTDFINMQLEDFIEQDNIDNFCFFLK